MISENSIIHTDISLHVPSLQAVSIVSGRHLLDEFGDKDTGDEGREARLRLSDGVLEFVRKIFKELRDINKDYYLGGGCSLEDVFWLAHPHGFHDDLELDWGGIRLSLTPFDNCMYHRWSGDVYLSILSHVRLGETMFRDTHDCLGKLILHVTEAILSIGRDCVPKLKVVLRDLSVRMRTVFGDGRCCYFLSYALLAYVPASLRTYFISLGANCDTAMTFGNIESNPLIIAAGTGQLDYVKEHLSSGINPHGRLDNMFCLRAAAMANSLDIASYIVGSDHELNDLEARMMMLALKHGFLRGNREICSYLLSLPGVSLHTLAFGPPLQEVIARAKELVDSTIV